MLRSSDPSPQNNENAKKTCGFEKQKGSQCGSPAPFMAPKKQHLPPSHSLYSSCHTQDFSIRVWYPDTSPPRVVLLSPVRCSKIASAATIPEREKSHQRVRAPHECRIRSVNHHEEFRTRGRQRSYFLSRVTRGEDFRFSGYTCCHHIPAFSLPLNRIHAQVYALL